MRIVQRSIWIDRPRDEVFAFFIDLSQANRWRQYVQSMRQLDEGPLRQGSRLVTTLDLMGERQTMEMEVLAFERPSLWRHRTNETDFLGYVEYRFDVEGAGTRVTLTMQAKPVGVYGWLTVPLIWLGRRKSYREQLPNLKRVMEG